ncbi:MAG: xylulokinase [Planctomycetota bacterium]|nr:MAG: xylulokinase [Planctomycetota bacterium]
MALFLGLDAGTQGAKALVWDAEADRVLGRGAASYGLLPAREPGGAEQHPWTWVEGVEAAIAQALADPAVEPRAIRGLAVSAQQHGFVPLDESNEVIRPARLWCDTATAAEAAELASRWGRPLPAGYTASKVLWLKRHEPEHFARLRRVLLPHDFLNLHLTGVVATEAGDASGTGWFDPERRDWDTAAAASIDDRLPAMLPPILRPDEPLGRIRPGLAARLGLPKDLLVAPGSGDNMMSALGAGAVREGVLVVSLGTSGTLFARSERPVVDPEGLIAPFCDATGAWLPLLCTMNCTTVLEEVRSAFGLDLERLTELAAAEPAGCDGLTFLPYLAGERAPDWPHARAAILGLGPGSLRPGRVFRAALEGATLALRFGLERLLRFGVHGDELRVVGGGSRNRLWRRILADAFGLPVQAPAEKESAALGAAIQAAAVWSGRPVASFARSLRGRVPAEPILPDPAAQSALRDALDRFRRLGRALFGSGGAAAVENANTDPISP